MSDVWNVNITTSGPTTVTVVEDDDEVIVNHIPPFKHAIVFSNTPPVSPSQGDIWLDPA